MQQKKIDAILTYAQSLTNLKDIGGKWLGCCPLHDERTPSFYIYPETGKFACYGCGEIGDVIDLYRKVTGEGFTEAKKALGFWDDSPTYRPVKALSRRTRKDEIELTDTNKKEVYIACRQAMIDRKPVKVLKSGKHYAYDFEFVWECIDGQMSYVYDICWRMPGWTGDEFYNYVWLKIGEEENECT